MYRNIVARSTSIRLAVIEVILSVMTSYYPIPLYFAFVRPSRVRTPRSPSVGVRTACFTTDPHLSGQQLCRKDRPSRSHVTATTLSGRMARPDLDTGHRTRTKGRQFLPGTRLFVLILASRSVQPRPPGGAARV